jgi:hypothetical protein
MTDAEMRVRSEVIYRDTSMTNREAALLVAVTSAILVWLGRGSLGAAGPWLFLVGVLPFIYLPGALTLELFGWTGRRSVALILASGLPSGLFLWYGFSRLLPAHGYLVLMVLVLFLVGARRPNWLRPAPMNWSRTSVAGVLVVVLLVLGSLSQTSYRSVEPGEDGGLGYTHSVDFANVKLGGSDAFFHAGVTSAIARSPGRSTNPYLIGAPLTYHAGMDRLSSAFARELRISPIDLAARFLPTLFVLVLSALVYQLARALGLTSFYGLVAVVLTFASDGRLLLYLLPVKAEWPARYWLGYFTAYPATTFYWTNPLLPALVVFVAGLLVLGTCGSGLRGRLLAGVLFGTTALFKVFLALHVAAVLSLLLVARYLRSRGTELIPVAGIAGAIMLGAAVGNSLYGESEVSFRFEFLGPVKASFRGAGLEPLADAIDGVRDAPGLLVTVQAVASFVFYLAMLLGVRLVAVPSSLRTAFGGSDQPVRSFIALFFLLGLVPALVLSIRVSGLNNSFWFTNQSLFMGALPVASTLAGVGRSNHRHLAVAIALVISLVPTWRDLRFRGRQPQARWSAAELEASLALRELSDAEAVVLHPINREAPSPASHIAGRATVLTYWQGYPFSFAPAEEVEQRAADIAAFYRTEDPSLARSILSKYGVTWVYAPAAFPARVQLGDFMEEAFVNDEVILYRPRADR